MTVNKLTSVKTQLPYKYYSLPVCKPAKIEERTENIGEIIAGDRIESSLYNLKMEVEEYCKVLCKITYTEEDVKAFQEKIADDYRVHWIIDNLPSVVQVFDENEPDAKHYEPGFPLGIYGSNQGNNVYYLYNHLRFIIEYHKNEQVFEGARVVGFIIETFTVRHEYDPADWGEGAPPKGDFLRTCKKDEPVNHSRDPQLIMEPGEVVWTYDVTWKRSDVPWASRWDVFLKGPPDDQIHWFSIINSLMIVLFLTGMVAMIMMRTLHKDIAKYNEEQTAEEAQEETGWKLVHGDVFRPPMQYGLLSVFSGTGVQIMSMSIALMIFAVLGLLSPANRGGLLTALLLLFVAMGSISGYVSARLYKMFGGKQWKRNTALTATLYPGTVFSVFFVVNLFVWHRGSSGAVPFSTMFGLLVLWLGISFPLTTMGSIWAFKKEEIKNPARYNQIPRQIPEQPCYMYPVISILVGGILPFGAVFIELFFIMSSIWLHQVRILLSHVYIFVMVTFFDV